jgi:CheY-like chemotaxis protein
VAAIESFRAAPERFDVVLSDEAMPGMTGSELAEEIHKIRPDIPIVLMSGFTSAALASRARPSCSMEVVMKQQTLVEQLMLAALAGLASLSWLVAVVLAPVAA